MRSVASSLRWVGCYGKGNDLSPVRRGTASAGTSYRCKSRTTSVDRSDPAFVLIRAEAAGFEPARGVYSSTRLAGGRHRPD